MTHLRIHLISIAIIGFLAYQYWTKSQALEEAVRSIEMFDELLKFDNVIVEKSSMVIKHEIDKQFMAYPSPINKSFLDRAINVMLISNSLKFWFEKQKIEFINISGGFNKKDSNLLNNRLSSKTSRQFFTDLKIKEIRDSLTHFQTFLAAINENYKLKELQNQYVSNKLLGDESYWH